MAVNYTLCVCVRVISDFSGQTVAKERSVKTSLLSQSPTSNVIVYSAECCG